MPGPSRPAGFPLGPTIRGRALQAEGKRDQSGNPLAKRWAATAARSRVAVSLVLAAAACWLAQPSPASLQAGIPVALSGLAIRAWSAGHLRKNQQLAVSGPYAHVRNPLYIGSLLAGVGSGIASNQAAVLAVIIVVFAFWFLPVIKEEEDHIREILPGYQEYEARVRRFLPSIAPRFGTRTRFNPALYMANREYSALAGFLAFMAILLAKLQST